MRAILVVQSDDTQRLRISGALTLAGYRVAAIESGLEAARWLGWARPALVITDAHLPDFTVKRLAALIRACEPQRWVPVIALSPRPLTEEVFGADVTLGSPAAAADIVRTVAALLGTRTAERPSGAVARATAYAW